MNQPLFNASTGPVDREGMTEAVKACGATDCDILYVHTDMTFGLPALKRNQLLAEIQYMFESLEVTTIIFPTFTFSFCNNEDYDVQKSKTAMGAINEFIRKSGHGARTLDPLLSVYVLGNPLNLLDTPGEYSIGADSTYDRLQKSDKKTKFLFFGAKMWECFTYTHYVEAMIGVPYRYNRLFKGNIVNNGVSKPGHAYLYSTYANCRLSPHAVVYDYMNKKGQLKHQVLGDGALCCVDEKDGWQSITELLEKNIYCLTDDTFDETVKDDTYNSQGTRVVSVR